MKSSAYFIDVAQAKRLAQEDAAVACALAAETVQRLYCAYEELAGNTFATVERRYGISWTWRRANQTVAS